MQDCSNSSVFVSIRLAEEFLDHVVNNSANPKNFDELRLWLYHHSKVSSIENLPPTSILINLHIR